MRLIFSIGFVDMAALEAPLRCVGGIDKLDGNAFESGFVTDERAKLEERPGAAACPVFSLNPCLVKELHEFFQCNAL